jgi:signal transduction histidine kinase
VLQFALPGALAMLLVGLAAVGVLRRNGTDAAIADAKRVTRFAADGIAAPLVTRGVIAGDPRALGRLDAVVHRSMLRDPVVRVKIWDGDGRIVYSDEPRLVGRRYRLDDEELEALHEGGVDAEVSDLASPENRYERRYGKLLEVYRGIRAPGGERLLFESYQRSSSLAASGRRLWQRFLPALIGALVLLELVQIPLAFLLARRLRDRQREHQALLQRAVDASEAERRRIAGALHDGPVQELASVAFSLSAASARLDDGARADVDAAAALTRDTMRNLRAMLVDLYPATLHRSGLQAAISDLLSPLASAGVDTDCQIPADLQLPTSIEAILFRAAREALQNVRKHAHASHAEVCVEVTDRTAVLTVVDDGVGFEAEPVLAGGGAGHFGLRMMQDLAAEADGRVRFDSVPNRGTRVRLEVPLS